MYDIRESLISLNSHAIQYLFIYIYIYLSSTTTVCLSTLRIKGSDDILEMQPIPTCHGWLEIKLL